MTDPHPQSLRLKTLLSNLNISQTVLAQRLGFTRGYISLIVNGDKPISHQVLNGLTKMFPTVNINWLLTGIGEPTLEEEGGKTYQIDKEKLVIIGEPEMEHIETLREAVLDRYKPDPPLSLKQDLTLRQACLKVITDNPGQPWSALVVGAGVYLRFIEAYPNLAIPEASGNP